MNSMMASSKRFLVSKEDYDRLYYLGSEEFLIEYLLKEGADSNVFKTAYENANLPMNGSTITRPLIKMMNVLSNGIMIGIILLFVNRILKKLNEMTAMKALTQQEITEKKNHNKVCILLVTCIAVFLMMIPTNLYSTMSSPDFVTYMGIGDGQIRMDILLLLADEPTGALDQSSSQEIMDEFVALNQGGMSTLAFVGSMAEQGVKVVIYVEYVPVDGNSRPLALDDANREYMMQRLLKLRKNKNIDKTTGNQDMVLIAFPGDEKTSGGCLAAGRGFFHINARGGAEPCPFSPYSDTNLKTISLKEALNSPLFLRLQNGGNLTEEHIGGCVLFEQRDKVEAFLQGASR